MSAVGACLLSAVMIGASFAPWHQAWLGWISFVPALVVMRGASRARALRVAALVAVTGTIATVNWMPPAVSIYYQQPLVVGIGLLLGVTTLMVVPPFVAFALAYHRLRRLPAPLTVLGGAAAWVLTEYARANLWTGNPWALQGYSQVGVRAVMQGADLAGIYGVTFPVFLVNLAIAESIARPARATAALSTAVIVVAATLGYGHLRLREFDAAPPATVGVTVIQGNIDLGAHWNSDLHGRNLDTYLHLTGQALQAGPSRVVVWPEGAFTFFLDDEPLYQEAIGLVLRPHAAELIAGGPQYAGRGASVFHNAAYLLSPTGTPRARYDKRQLLPFAEYFPFGAVSLLRRSFGRVREFAVGEPTPPLPSAAGAGGVLICNEALFPDRAREAVREGATWLVTLTNDTWIGSRQFATMAADMAIARAIETRRWLVRASTSGPSMIVDPAGRVVAQTAIGTPAFARAAIAPRTDQTPYVRHGDVFVGACAVAALALLAIARRWRMPE
jgi:apolipoprotein N-acyltransferase